MSERTDRLKGIHIEDYTQDEKELPVFAMLRLYLNCAEKPEKAIGENLPELLRSAAVYAMCEINSYAGDMSPFNQFFSNLDCEKLTAANDEQFRRFLEDCKKELNAVDE